MPTTSTGSSEHRLVVRRAQKGETLTAINNRVYELSPEMLVIADAARPVGLAGVMGGAETEISARDDPRPDRSGAVRSDFGAADVACARAYSARRASVSSGRSTPRSPTGRAGARAS